MRTWKRWEGWILLSSLGIRITSLRQGWGGCTKDRFLAPRTGLQVSGFNARIETEQDRDCSVALHSNGTNMRVREQWTYVKRACIRGYT